MQELEKILKEIEHKKWECINRDYIYGSGDRVNGLDMAIDIIRKHMNDGWIPVEDRLPERTLDEKINESYQKYLVFIDGVDGWDIDIAVYDFWNDKKWREAHDGYGEIENVIAWRPLPEPYRPERRDNHDGE